MQELILQLDPEPKFEFVSAANNAAWSVGEVALRYGRGGFPHVFDDHRHICSSFEAFR